MIVKICLRFAIQLNLQISTSLFSSINVSSCKIILFLRQGDENSCMRLCGPPPSKISHKAREGISWKEGIFLNICNPQVFVSFKSILKIPQMTSFAYGIITQVTQIATYECKININSIVLQVSFGCNRLDPRFYSKMEIQSIAFGAC